MAAVTTPESAEGPRTILVCDDAPEAALLVQASLERDSDYVIEVAADGAEALDKARALDPDLVVLDLGLPGIDGIDVCRELRTFTDAYVLMLTGRDGELDRLIGLAVGADDYVTKPFSGREVAARVRALLRRPRVSTLTTADAVVADDVCLDLLAREVRVGGELVELTKLQFDLLALLASHPGEVVSYQVLFEAVWRSVWVGEVDLVNSQVAKLRQKIDRPSQSHITTCRGVGYSFTTNAANSSTTQDRAVAL